jgi:hypothetical protein
MFGLGMRMSGFEQEFGSTHRQALSVIVLVCGAASPRSPPPCRNQGAQERRALAGARRTSQSRKTAHRVRPVDVAVIARRCIYGCDTLRSSRCFRRPYGVTARGLYTANTVVTINTSRPPAE